MTNMTFILQQGDSRPETFPLKKYGGKAKVSWGRPGKRAGIWNIIANPNGEVYIMEINTGGALKVSLHKTGDWRFQWIEENAERNQLVKAAIDAAGTRIIDQWTRPPALSGDTLTPAYTIFTTGQDITTVSDSPDIESKVVWLPEPQEDEMAFLGVSFVRPTGKPVTFRGYLPVDAFAMKTGEALFITAARRKMTDDERAQVNKHREIISRANDYVQKELSASRNLRAIFHGQNGNGARWIFDLAFPRAELGDKAKSARADLS